MIFLRNSLLTANGLFLLMGIPFVKTTYEIGWALPIVLAIYLVLDFIYLSLTYPQRPFREYLSLFRGEIESSMD